LNNLGGRQPKLEGRKGERTCVPPSGKKRTSKKYLLKKRSLQTIAVHKRRGKDRLLKEKANEQLEEGGTRSLFVDGVRNGEKEGGLRGGV